MIEYKGKAPVNTRLNPIGPLEGKPLLAYYNSFVWATLVASGSVWVGRLKSPLAVKGLRRVSKEEHLNSHVEEVWPSGYGACLEIRRSRVQDPL